jgi:predicted transcriptional regulator
MDNESTTVLTVGVPRALRDELHELAKANWHSTAAEVRQALAEHVERAREEKPAAVERGAP